MIIGSALALLAVSYDYLTGGTKAIGDSQLGAFFVAMAVGIFGAILLKFIAVETLKHRIRAFEKIHKNVKADPLKGLKGLFAPIGLLGALAGLGIMVGLTLKDYSPPLTFGIGPSQMLGIFGGSILAIAGLSFMSVGNTFITVSMRSMVHQFEGLTKKRPKEEAVTEEDGQKEPPVTKEPTEASTEEEPAAVPVPEPVVPTISAPTQMEDEKEIAKEEGTGDEAQVVESAPPSPPPTSPQVEAVEPEPVKEGPAPQPAEVSVKPKAPEEPAWSDKKAEEEALVAMTEAEAELGLKAMEAAIKEKLDTDDGTGAAERETVPSGEIEVFECPTCGAAVAQDDVKCPSCGVSFDDESEEETPAEAEPKAEEEPVEAVAPVAPVVETKQEEEVAQEPAAPPEPEPPAPPAPSARPPPLPPRVPVPATTKDESLEDVALSGGSGVLQSILDEITKKGPTPTKVEEPAPVEEDIASEVPSTCPNCGRKMKTRWKSCPYCGLEFR